MHKIGGDHAKPKYSKLLEKHHISQKYHGKTVSV